MSTGGPVLKVLVMAASLVVVVAGLKTGAALLGPLMLGGFLAVLGSGPVAWLTRRGLPRGPSVLLVSAIMVAMVAFTLTLLTNSLNQFTATIPRYSEPLSQRVSVLNGWLAEHGYKTAGNYLRQMLEPARVIYWLGTTISHLAGMLSAAAMAMVFMIFILIEAADYPQKVRMVRPSAAPPIELGQVILVVQHYLIIKTLTSALTGLAVGLGCWVVGLDFSALWGLTAFLLNYIPYVGSMVAAVPALCLAAIQFGPASVIGLGFFYLGVNFTMGNLIEPVLMGHQLGLSPLVVLLSVVFWGGIWGPLGMLMAVPIATTARLVMQYIPELQSLAVLMGPRPERAPGIPLADESLPAVPASHT